MFKKALSVLWQQFISKQSFFPSIAFLSLVMYALPYGMNQICFVVLQLVYLLHNSK